MAKRKQLDEFLEHLFAPYLALQKKGFFHQTGHGANDQEPWQCVAYPYIIMQIGNLCYSY